MLCSKLHAIFQSFLSQDHASRERQLCWSICFQRQKDLAWRIWMSKALHIKTRSHFLVRTMAMAFLSMKFKSCPCCLNTSRELSMSILKRNFFWPAAQILNYWKECRNRFPEGQGFLSCFPCHTEKARHNRCISHLMKHCLTDYTRQSVRVKMSQNCFIHPMSVHISKKMFAICWESRISYNLWSLWNYVQRG